MTLEEIKKTGDKKAILKYRTQCAKDSVKEYREQMRDATPEEQESSGDLISRQVIKSEYKRKLKETLIDKDRNIDLTEYADCSSFNEFVDSIPSIKLQPCEDVISRQIISDYVESHIQEINTGYGDLNWTPYYEILQSAVRNGMGDNSQKIITNGIPLDKIRAEIEMLNPVDYGLISSYESHNGAKDMKSDVLEIIDKYRNEVSDKE